MAAAFLLLWVAGTSAARAMSNNASYFISLGGSNTCGHYVHPSLTFHAMVARGLVNSSLISHAANRCTPAMGPDAATTCLGSVLPMGRVAYATVEYLPNMLTRESAQREAFDSLLGALSARGVRVVVVNVLPQKRARNVFARLPWIEAANNARAAELGMARLTVAQTSEDSPLFHREHLSVNGHAEVARHVLAIFERWDAPDARAARGGATAALSQTASSTTASCAIGAGLEPALVKATGFARADIRGVGAREPKIVWEAREPGAYLALCAVAAGRFPNGSSLLIGLQMSHELNLPLMGVASLSCAGCACAMARRPPLAAQPCPQPGSGPMCTVDLLQRTSRTTETVFIRLDADVPLDRAFGPAACACELHVRSAPAPGSARARLLVRALLVTDRDPTRVAVSHGAHRAVAAIDKFGLVAGRRLQACCTTNAAILSA